MPSRVVPSHIASTLPTTADASGSLAEQPLWSRISSADESNGAVSTPHSPTSSWVDKTTAPGSRASATAAVMAATSEFGLSDESRFRTSGSDVSVHISQMVDVHQTNSQTRLPAEGRISREPERLKLPYPEGVGGSPYGESRFERPNMFLSESTSSVALPADTATVGVVDAWTKQGGSRLEGMANHVGREGGGGGGEGEAGRKRQSHANLKTVAELPGILRRHVASYAEHHHQDISAEINSLSKISAQDEVEEMPRLLLNHDSSTKLAWDIFMMILIIFSAFADPVQIGFHRHPEEAIWILEILVDFIFIADVFLTFRTTVVDPETKDIITDPKKIAVRYLKGTFLLDVLSSVPVHLLFHDMGNSSSGFGKFFVVLELLRMLKLHQLSVITAAVLERFEDRAFNPAMFRIYIFVLAFTLVVHFIACTYWLVSWITDPEFEGLWSPEEEYLEEALYKQYIRAVYYSLVITYGNDLKPENDIEVIFSNVCLMLALLTNAIIIGSATTLLSNMDAGAVAKKTQMDGINGYMRFRKVPKDLQKRIRTYYEYLWESGQDGHSSALFEEMPEKLKLQLNIALKKRLIDKVPLFKTFSPAGSIALVQNLVTSIILPGELIVRQGEPATSMFFISRGTVRVYVVSETDDSGLIPPEETYIISLGAGSFFGEISLLDEKHLRTANVRAETFTELQVIHAEDFKALAEVFPEFKSAVKAISKSRKKLGETLGKMTMRGKQCASRKDLRSGATSRGFKMRGAAATVKAQNEIARDERKKSRMRVWVECLMATHRGGNRENIASAGSMCGTSSRRLASPLRGGRGSLDRGLRAKTIYDTIMDHEALVSHEAAISVARGGGIVKENLEAWNNV